MSRLRINGLGLLNMYCYLNIDDVRVKLTFLILLYSSCSRRIRRQVMLQHHGVCISLPTVGNTQEILSSVGKGMGCVNGLLRGIRHAGECLRRAVRCGFLGLRPTRDDIKVKLRYLSGKEVVTFIRGDALWFQEANNKIGVNVRTCMGDRELVGRHCVSCLGVTDGTVISVVECSPPWFCHDCGNWVRSWSNHDNLFECKRCLFATHCGIAANKHTRVEMISDDGRRFLYLPIPPCPSCGCYFKCVTEVRLHQVKCPGYSTHRLREVLSARLALLLEMVSPLSFHMSDMMSTPSLCTDSPWGKSVAELPRLIATKGLDILAAIRWALSFSDPSTVRIGSRKFCLQSVNSA